MRPGARRSDRRRLERRIRARGADPRFGRARPISGLWPILASSLLDRRPSGDRGERRACSPQQQRLLDRRRRPAVLEAEQLLASADVAAALDLEAFGANLSPLAPHRRASCGPFPGLRTTLDRLHLDPRRDRAPGKRGGRGTCRTRSRSAASRRSTARPGTHSLMPGGLVETEVNSAQGNPAISIEERTGGLSGQLRRRRPCCRPRLCPHLTCCRCSPRPRSVRSSSSRPRCQGFRPAWRRHRRAARMPWRSSP